MTENTANFINQDRQRSQDRFSIILAVLASFISCFAIPIASSGKLGSAVAIAATVICSVVTVRFSSRKILTLITLVGLFSSFGLSGSLPIISILLACTVGCGCFAWLISKTESPFLALIPTLAYAASTVITKSWFGSLLTLVFVLPAILLAQSYEKLNSRVSSLLRVSFGFLVFIALGILLSMLYFTGEVNTQIIGEVLDSIRDTFVKLLSSYEMSMVNGETQALMSETDAYNLVSMVISLLPALTVILCYALAYLAQKVQFSIFISTEGERSFNELRRVFIMSPISAVVFVTAFLVYTVAATDRDSEMLATVTSNLYLILTPGLAFMGIKSFLEGRSRLARRGCSSLLISSLFIFLLFFSTGTAIITAACFGAYCAIEAPIRKHFQKKNNK